MILFARERLKLLLRSCLRSAAPILSCFLGWCIWFWEFSRGSDSICSLIPDCSPKHPFSPSTSCIRGLSVIRTQPKGYSSQQSLTPNQPMTGQKRSAVKLHDKWTVTGLRCGLFGPSLFLLPRIRMWSALLQRPSYDFKFGSQVLLGSWGQRNLNSHAIKRPTQLRSKPLLRLCQALWSDTECWITFFAHECMNQISMALGEAEAIWIPALKLDT